MASITGLKETPKEGTEIQCTRDSSSMHILTAESIMGSPTDQSELLLKQKELIELLTLEVAKLRKVRNVALQLHKYYHGKASAIYQLLSKQRPLNYRSDYMDVLEATARCYVRDTNQEIATLQQRLQDTEKLLNSQPPQQRIVYVDRRIEVPSRPVFVDRIVEKPIIMEVTKEVEKEVVKIQYKDREVEKIVYVDREVLIDRPVEKIVERLVQMPAKQVIKVVEKTVYVDKPIFITKEVQAPPKILYIDRPATNGKRASKG